MKTCHRCQIATRDRDNARRPASHWRRGREAAGWIIPGAVLILLPKCPICVAAYVMLFSGVAISIESASKLRATLLVLSVAALLFLALKYSRRHVAKRLRKSADSALRRIPGCEEAGPFN